MKVEAHIIAWNEAETIHLTIRHYKQFCDRIIIYDNFSTDNTREIAESLECEIKPFGIAGVLDDREYTKLKNNCWKGSNADWVIIVDADEILDFSEDNFQRLARLRFEEYTLVKPKGWQVVSQDVPIEFWGEVKTGFQYDQYSKLCCFNPKEVKEIDYVHGCHVAKPKGSVRIIEAGTLFHYRKVGGVDRLLKRYALYKDRMSDWNIRWNAGEHYRREEQRLRKEWKEEWDKSVEFDKLVHG